MKKLPIILLYILAGCLRNALAQNPCYFNKQDSLYYFNGSDSLCDGEFKEVFSIMNDTILYRYDDGKLMEYSSIGMYHSFSTEFYGSASLTLGSDQDKKRDWVVFESPTIIFNAPLNVKGEVKGGYCRTKNDVMIINSPFFKDSIVHINLRKRKKLKLHWQVGKEKKVVSCFKSIYFINFNDSLSAYIKSPLAREGLIEVGPRYTYWDGMLNYIEYFKDGFVLKQIENPGTKWEVVRFYNYKGEVITP